MSTQASVVINKLRDLGPDPVYDSAGNPLPTTDGGFWRSQTCYRFLSDAVKACAQGMGWFVQDWFALPATANQPAYLLDPHWTAMQSVIVNGWVLAPIDEVLTIYPGKEITQKQPIRYFQRKFLDQITVGIFPAPTVTDPTPTLLGTMTSVSSTATFTTTAGWLQAGYFQVESEIIRYETIDASSTFTLTRGQCGTTAAAHNANLAATHLSIWVKGPRMPMDITTATDIIELPSAFIYPLELYVLSKYRQSEQEFGEARALMKDFENELEKKRRDPYWQSLDSNVVQPFDAPAYGPLAWNRVIVP